MAYTGGNDNMAALILETKIWSLRQGKLRGQQGGNKMYNQI